LPPITKASLGLVEERYADLLSNLRQDLDHVEVAMRRLEEGNYGRCEVCGTAFSADELEARPAAMRCSACE
jgi:DnaK suppressor protein